MPCDQRRVVHVVSDDHLGAHCVRNRQALRVAVRGLEDDARYSVLNAGALQQVRQANPLPARIANQRAAHLVLDALKRNTLLNGWQGAQFCQGQAEGWSIMPPRVSRHESPDTCGSIRFFDTV